jgi:hypothetical protein
VVTAFYMSPTPSVYLLAGDGTGALGGQVPLLYSAGSAGFNPVYVLAADFNGDRTIDAAVLSQSTSGAKLVPLVNKGGAFAAGPALDLGTLQPSSPTVLDLAGFDGKPDIVVSAQPGDGLLSLYNTSQ